MVKFFFLGLFCLNAHADFLNFGKSDSSKGKIPELTEKMRSLSIKNNPAFEDDFNKTVKELEQTVETEKLYCKGEASGPDGQVLAKTQKELCFRDLKKVYLEATRTVFEVKKKYLAQIHSEQLEKLNTVQKDLEAGIERSF